MKNIKHLKKRQPMLLLMLVLTFFAEVQVSGQSSNEIVQAWFTEGDNGTEILEKKADITPVAGSGSQSYNIVVDESITTQEIVGFGAAMTEGSADLIYNSPFRNEIMEKIFSKENGAGVNFVRVTIGASDHALSAYSYEETPGNFTIDRDKEAKIPLLQQAKQINPDLLFMGSPWSAPAWMKTSNSMSYGSLKPDNYDEYAQYLVNFIQAYEAEGIPMYAITIQNEPLHEAGYPTMKMTKTECAEFVKVLGPLFEANNITTKIIVYDHNFFESGNAGGINYPQAIYNDPVASQYVAGAGWHSYDPYPGDPSQMTILHNQYPDKGNYFTERTGQRQDAWWGDTFDYFLYTNIERVMENWGKCALMWNIALNQYGGPRLDTTYDGSGFVTVYENEDENGVYGVGDYEVMPDLAGVGHYSVITRPGAIRIESTDFQSSASSTNGVPDGVYSESYLNPDGSTGIMVYNRYASSNDISVTFNNTHWDYTLPAYSAVSFLVNGEDIPDVSVTGVELLPEAITIEEGQSANLTATVLPTNATNKTVTWSSSDESIATVDANGNVTAIAPGTADITVTTEEGNYSAVTTVTTQEAPPCTPNIPGKFEAEDYTYQSGIQTEETSDDGGGLNIGWIDVGDILEYDGICVSSNGTFNLESRVAGNAPGGQFELRDQDGNVLAVVDIPNTYSWQNWTSVNQSVQLTESITKLVIVIASNNFNLNWFEFTPIGDDIPVDGVALLPASLTLDEGQSTNLTATVSPQDATNQTVTWSSSDESIATVDASGNVTAVALGTADITVTTEEGNYSAVTTATTQEAPACTPNIPSKFEAEDYTYQSGIQTENTTDDGGGLNVGWIDAGDILEYDGICVASSETYNLESRVAGNAPGGQFELQDQDGNVLAVVDIPNTGSWQSWTSVNQSVQLTESITKLVIVMTNNNFNLNWFEFTPIGDDIPVDGVALLPASLTLDEGQSTSLTATVLPPDATNQSVTWSSSDESIATVDVSGNVTAVAEGNATITVTTVDGNFTDVTAVTVSAIVLPVTSVSVTPETLVLEEGQSASLTATVSPSNAANQAVIWSSSDESIATVDANGNVTAVASGSADITATTEDGGFTDLTNVTISEMVISVTSVAVDISTLALVAGESANITATVSPSDATNQAVTWSSSDESIATVDASGNVTAVTEGDATITVTADDGGFTDLTDVTVSAVYVPATSVSVNPETIDIIINESASLTATVLPANASNQAVTWSSSDESIATVDVSGLVTAVALGTADITVTTEEGNYSALTTVTTQEIPSCTPNIPGRFEAEDYTSESATTINTGISDVGGGDAVFTGWSNNGAQIEFDDICIVNDGIYNLEIRVASNNTNGQYKLQDQDGNVLAVVSIPNTYQIDSWQSVNTTVQLTRSITKLVVVMEGVWALNWSEFSPIGGAIPVDGVAILPVSLTLDEGQSTNLTATVSPSEATNQAVTWSSSDESIATVDASGNLTAVAEGDATITVTTDDGGFTDLTDVTVSAVYVPVTGVYVNPETIDIIINEAASLTATVLPANASNQAVTWSSSDESIATVDTNGNVTAVALGTADITVTTEEGNYSAVTTVTTQEIPSCMPNIPGKFEAEDYTSESATTINTGISDVGGGNAVFTGWNNNGAQIEIDDICIVNDGTYNLEIRVASNNTNGQYKLQDQDGNELTVIDIPNTFQIDLWQSVNTTVQLTKSITKLVVVMEGVWALNWSEFTAISGAMPVDGVDELPVNLSSDEGQSTNLAATASPLDAPNEDATLESATFEAQSNSLMLYPNPANSTVTIMGLEEDAQIEVYSIAGAKVAESYGANPNIRDLTSGVYIVRVIQNGTIKQMKLVKR